MVCNLTARSRNVCVGILRPETCLVVLWAQADAKARQELRLGARGIGRQRCQGGRGRDGYRRERESKS